MVLELLFWFQAISKATPVATKTVVSHPDISTVHEYLDQFTTSTKSDTTQLITEILSLVNHQTASLNDQTNDITLLFVHSLTFVEFKLIVGLSLSILSTNHVQYHVFQTISFTYQVFNQLTPTEIS